MEEMLRNIAVAVLTAAVTGFLGSAFVKPALFDRIAMYVFYISGFIALVTGCIGVGATRAGMAYEEAFSSLAKHEGVILPSAPRALFDSKTEAIFDWAHDANVLALAFSALAVLTGLLHLYVYFTEGEAGSEDASG